jgi:predicted nucleotidyltransferase
MFQYSGFTVHPADKRKRSHAVTIEGDAFLGSLERWREIIDLRAEEAVEAISAIPQVVGIILGGSVGRGQAWPLSDIDLIYVAASTCDRDLPRRIVEIGRRLSENRVSYGWSTSIDVGKLFMTQREAFDLTTGRVSLESLMGSERVFHALDKCNGGRPAFVSEACDTARLAALLTKERFSEPVVRARQRERVGTASRKLQEAGHHLGQNDMVSAAVSVEQTPDSVSA